MHTLPDDGRPFIKMHGLGNDFLVVDARIHAFAPDAGQVRMLADRRRGVGCDQLIVLEEPRDSFADAFMRIRNADGSEAGACGNATRCVAALLMREKQTRHVVVETMAGLLDAEARADGQVSVDMGRVRFDWRDIPLSKPADTLDLGLSHGPLHGGVAVNVGNPHVVFFVNAVAAVALEVVGPAIERDALFPEYANVEAVEVLARDRLRVRVWERGAGLTPACGTGACAALIAAARRGLAERKAEVVLDGGVLTVEWLRDDHVLMTGPVATSFVGVLDPALLGGPDAPRERR